MKISDLVHDKIDGSLRETLDGVAEDQPIRVIVITPPQERTRPEGELSPSQFPNQLDYRQALIDAQRRRVEEEVGPLAQAISQMGLKVSGGRLQPNLVVEGVARLVLKALELDQVQRAVLDKKISLIDPVDT